MSDHGLILRERGIESADIAQGAAPGLSDAPIPITSVLVANRGEIAARVLRTVRAMGLRALLIAHPVDAHAPALELADAVHWFDPASSPISAFLDIASIVQAGRAMGADAIHPGYGFLSENANFARAVSEAGMVFIGPGHEAIDLMGDKVRAREFVASRNFPVAPSAIEDHDPSTFLARAKALGMPLLIKPSAGGGGKGMRIVRDPAMLAEEIERARSEAQRYFGDGRLYAERYFERPRHIEVQIFGDHQGNIVHLHERECSIQRRFQKIIEEAPAPALSDVLRTAICEAAAGIARAVGYANAGTVEFIYEDGAFYFLEMNTRLQVEHPVTEAITGLDLVELQIRIAAGLPLPLMQEEITCSGHAIELRICAEEPANDFAPSIGTILKLQMPPHVRFDAGVTEGSQVTTAFDPMIGKLIVHGHNRAHAIERARLALRQVVLFGVQTNMPYLQRLLSDPDMIAGAVHTGLIGEKPDLAHEPEPDAALLSHLAALAAPLVPELRREVAQIPALHAALGGWRN